MIYQFYTQVRILINIISVYSKKKEQNNKMEILLLGSTGPNVKLIQSLLKRIGYSPGAVDGKFGFQTRKAVIEFQKDNRLYPDGVIGPATWQILNKLLRGYDIYTVCSGDTLYSISKRYYTSLNKILIANPDIDPDFLNIGQQIIVPHGIDVVFDDIDYTFEILERQVKGLEVRYPFLEVGTAGKSVLGKTLYYVRLGKGNNNVFYNGAHHANEWITTPLLMKFIESYAKAFSTGSTIRNYNIYDIYNSSSIYILPMVNPDGVNLVNYWPNYTEPVFQQAAKLNKTVLPLPSVWKANIRGVDLNVNYPAKWEKEHQLEVEHGIIGPSPRDYGGPYPLSEPESSSIVEFTRQHNFRLVIAYHTQGQVIYWQFDNLAPLESLPIARLFSKVSGYAISEFPSEAAYAGYKDWFIQEYKKPGFTIEAGIGKNPLPIDQLPIIYQHNEEILLLGAVV